MLANIASSGRKGFVRTERLEHSWKLRLNFKVLCVSILAPLKLIESHKFIANKAMGVII
jgi:hypothetical protein